MDWFLFLLTLLTGIVIYVSFKKRSLLESFGFPVSQPYLCFGSAPILWQRVFVHEFYKDQHKKFGKTWSRYFGAIPCIVTIDPDFIKSVMVKHFDSFTDMVNFDLPDNQTTLDASRGDVWRALRKALSPTFTIGKLKSMLDPMEVVADNLVKSIEEQIEKNPAVELKYLFQTYSLDTIARCAFSIDPKVQVELNNEILSHGRKVVGMFVCDNFAKTFFVNLILHCPWMIKLLGFFPESFRKIFSITKSLIHDRQLRGVDHGDFIARLTELVKKPEPPLNEDIICAQGVSFFLAGYETTSNTLVTLTRNLAIHSDIQEKIFQEIQDTIKDHDGIINIETISEMHYLDATISENLRMFPPILESGRCCTKDCTVNGVFIPKGTRVQMPTWASHYNEEFFPDPEKFVPERFLKENANSILPFTWRPFGGGNRACIGQRFAITEIKICMAKLLNKFYIKPTKVADLEYHKGSIGFLSYNDFKVEFVPRND